MQRILSTALSRIQELSTCELDETIAESVRQILDEVAREAAKAGQHEVLRRCQIGSPMIAPATGIAIISECLSLLTKEWLSLSEAAQYLGVSDSTLRRLVRRKAIKFSQSGKGACIRFRPEWLQTTAQKSEAVSLVAKRIHWQ